MIIIGFFYQDVLDIIFVCYLYQRWIYSVDKSRPSEWVEQQTLLSEETDQPTSDTTLLQQETEHDETLRLRKTRRSSSVAQQGEHDSETNTRDEEESSDVDDFIKDTSDNLKQD